MENMRCKGGKISESIFNLVPYSPHLYKSYQISICPIFNLSTENRSPSSFQRPECEKLADSDFLNCSKDVLKLKICTF
jgi:hypothetical protein